MQFTTRLELFPIIPVTIFVILNVASSCKNSEIDCMCTTVHYDLLIGYRNNGQYLSRRKTNVCHVIDVTFQQSNRMYFRSFVKAINKTVECSVDPCKFLHDFSHRFIILFIIKRKRVRKPMRYITCEIICILLICFEYKYIYMHTSLLFA